jgi:hypothetical protein
MKKSLQFKRIAGAITLSAVLVVAGSTLSAATTKPAGDRVPAGAKVMYFISAATPLSGVSANVDTTTTVTNATVIAQVRGLINSLPVTTTRPRVCPEDMMVPTWVNFSTSTSAAPFTKVLFQLGGCPYARVYQHGVVVSPTLGGTNLGVVYNKIKSLVEATK